MKCYHTPEHDAVGICKNCNKGLCINCLTEVNNSIACTSTCIEEVIELDKLINRNKTSYKSTSDAYKKNAYIYGSLGIAFIIFGLKFEGSIGFFSITGAIFIIGAIFNLISANKFGKE